MIWLAVAVASLVVSVVGKLAGRQSIESLGRVAFPASLLIWLWQIGNLPNLGGDEERLLLWFGWGLGAALLGEALRAIRSVPASLANAAPPLVALLYALGLDFLRPDAYATIPAAIVGFLVALLAVRVGRLAWPHLIRKTTAAKGGLALVEIIPYALLLYAAFYKLFDRSWLLPWSYLTAGGALLLVLSQLWKSWKALREQPGVRDSWILFAYQLANLLMVFAAYNHYRQYY
jgi:hypothetical protein